MRSSLIARLPHARFEDSLLQPERAAQFVHLLQDRRISMPRLTSAIWRDQVCGKIALAKSKGANLEVNHLPPSSIVTLFAGSLHSRSRAADVANILDHAFEGCEVLELTESLGAPVFSSNVFEALTASRDTLLAERGFTFYLVRQDEIAGTRTIRFAYPKMLEAALYLFNDGDTLPPVCVDAQVSYHQSVLAAYAFYHLLGISLRTIDVEGEGRLDPVEFFYHDIVHWLNKHEVPPSVTRIIALFHRLLSENALLNREVDTELLEGPRVLVSGTERVMLGDRKADVYSSAIFKCLRTRLYTALRRNPNQDEAVNRAISMMEHFISDVTDNGDMKPDLHALLQQALAQLQSTRSLQSLREEVSTAPQAIAS